MIRIIRLLNYLLYKKPMKIAYCETIEFSCNIEPTELNSQEKHSNAYNILLNYSNAIKQSSV
jgi:hypothetical protein